MAINKTGSVCNVTIAAGDSASGISQLNESVKGVTKVDNQNSKKDTDPLTSLAPTPPKKTK